MHGAENVKFKIALLTAVCCAIRMV